MSATFPSCQPCHSPSQLGLLFAFKYYPFFKTSRCLGASSPSQESKAVLEWTTALNNLREHRNSLCSSFRDSGPTLLQVTKLRYQSKFSNSSALIVCLLHSGKSESKPLSLDQPNTCKLTPHYSTAECFFSGRMLTLLSLSKGSFTCSSSE